MSSNNNDDSYNENTCVVCFKNVEIYSIGDCDHPVCYECSTRMRVLCRQNECPICRYDMQKVIFTYTIRAFKELEKSVGSKLLIDRKFKIVFENADIQQAYNSLLAHVCSRCPGRHAFQNFNLLREHMRKEHELFYCDLCVENLKILTHERRSYTRKELGTHRRQGDSDNRSHRGHPLCEFCDIRYMDNDELYRHLRRDHLFCHFCDADGLHQYYDAYEVLRTHFREQHFLCEEGECYEEKFTSAFRTEIDLKAHRASVHGRQMTKAAAKQARTLELAFTLKPRPRQSEQRRGRGRPNSHYNCSDEEEGAVGGMTVDYHRSSQPVTTTPMFTKINTASNDEFPSLGGSSAPSTQQGLHFRKPGVTIRAGGSLAMTEEDFPALGPEATASVSLRVNSGSVAERTRGAKPTNVSIHVNHRPGGVVTTVSQSRGKDPFPALNNKSSPPPQPSSHWKSTRESEPKFAVKTKSNQPTQKPAPLKSYRYDDEEDGFPLQKNFPALSGNIPSHIASLAANQWSSAKEPEPKFSVNKNKTSQPPPKPPQPKTFHIEDDFPSLNTRFDASCSFTSEPSRTVEPNMSGNKTKKDSSISIPVDNNWMKAIKGPSSTDTVLSDGDIGSKKNSKKKKNKAKKESISESSKIVPNKSPKNNETSKKNKQKEESKSIVKQIKVETESTKETNLENKKSEETSERKRSELKIENLNGQTENINLMNKAPSSGSNPRLPPGFTNVPKDVPAVPPGFEGVSSPPPGFSITLNSVARPPSNGLTFTSSSGHNYPINGGDGIGTSRVFSYVPPLNTSNRNAQLISQLKTALEQCPSGLQDFMQMSTWYLQGSLGADSYYGHCKEAMGENAFKQIFPELLVLLPDITKQQALWNVAEKSTEWKLIVCAACGQVVSNADFRHHQATHSLENHFPTLANGVAGPNAWTKK